MGKSLLLFVLFIFLNSSCFIVFASDTPAPIEDESSSNGIFDGILDFLLHLIIPEDDYWDKKTSELLDILNKKLPYQQYIDIIDGFSDLSEGESIEFYDQYADTDGVVYNFNFSKWLLPYMPSLRSIITGVTMLFLVYFNYRQIVYVIRGSNYQRIDNNNNS